ncbi:MAG: dihydroneopterin aldolase [Firmicutes bacterium]|nr:dihydroneopterin aldolase [Bacillota bacterium]
MGRIRLKQLRFYACHGVLPHEHQVPQEFWVDVDLLVPFKEAAEHDQLTETVDYAQVAEAVQGVMMGPPVRLLETLAYQILRRVRALDARILRVEVRVTKVAPPIGVPSHGVEVVVTDGD